MYAAFRNSYDEFNAAVFVPERYDHALIGDTLDADPGADGSCDRDTLHRLYVSIDAAAQPGSIIRGCCSCCRWRRTAAHAPLVFFGMIVTHLFDGSFLH